MCIVQQFKDDPEGTTKSLNNTSGTGLFSEVMLTSDENFAVKKSIKLHTDAWLVYALKCMELKYSWMPNIYSIVVDLENGKYVALMERLYEINEFDRFSASEKIYPLKSIMNLEGNISLYDDLGIDNVMKRKDGEELITDPFTYTGWRDLGGRNFEDDRIQKYIERLVNVVPNANFGNLENVFSNASST